MFKAGLAALLIGLLMAGPVPSFTAASSCVRSGSCCCCAPGQCHCHGPAKNGNGPCVCGLREKADFALAAAPLAAKPRVSVPLYLLPESKPADVRPLLVRAFRGQDPPPPFGGHSPQALFRLWLI
jgi:hypothetical protein